MTNITMRRKKLYTLLLIVLIFLIILKISILQSIFHFITGMLFKFDATDHLNKFFEHAPALQERLLLIDRNVLNDYHKGRFLKEHPCLFCSVPKYQPITFGLVTPVNRSLEEHILLPILRAWEGGFWVEQIVYSKYNKFSPIRLNLPLGFILQKGGTMIIEIVLLHQREGDFWWHGSLDQDNSFNEKLGNLKVADQRSSLYLNMQGAYDKIRFESITLDGLDLNVPRDLSLFFQTPSKFIECNYERADKFHRLYGKDVSGRANMFRHRVRKLLSTAKAILDKLKIPFWISSGTLLGYFRQCDVIPYSQDVDIGISIKHFNNSIIPAFASRGLRLKHKFGKADDGLEISFISRSVKLDIFFFYEEETFVWNGGHALIYENGQLHSGVKYRYKFQKFTLCWTEFLEMKLRIPCETEKYIIANYGPNWFRPTSKWHWYKDPYNVEKVGYWSPDEASQVLQIF